jgi:hypothetical protein
MALKHPDHLSPSSVPLDLPFLAYKMDARTLSLSHSPTPSPEFVYAVAVVDRSRSSLSCLAGDVPEPRPNLVVPCPPCQAFALTHAQIRPPSVPRLMTTPKDQFIF